MLTGSLPNQVVLNKVPQRTIFCIKDNLAKSLHLRDDRQLQDPRTRLFLLINHYVNRARDITIRVSMLDHLHTLRMCEDEDIVEHDQNYYYSLARAVCGNVQDIQDERLRASCEIFEESFDVPLDLSDLSTILAELAIDSVQNFNEHVSRNLQPIFCRLLWLQMYMDPLFVEDSTVIQKLALHVYKLLSNQATVWPHSVPRTRARVVKCQRLIELYFPWFRFLSELGDDRRDRDFNPNRNIQEDEEEDDDDIDMEIDEEELEGLLNDAEQPLPQQQQEDEVINQIIY